MANEKKNEILQALRSVKGSDILAELGKVAPLPSEGVVAGQAVASVLMSKMGLGFGAPINDVDVFLSAKTARGKEIESAASELNSRKRRHVETASRATKVRVGFDSGYSGMMQATVKSGYLITGTAREDMLNEVAYRPMHGEEVAAMAVLRGFDLNCVQAGVDAATGELIWTPAFESFALSGQLAVANVNTPFHTAARYFKKKAELGCFGDDELNMAMCALPWARGVFDRDIPGGSSVSLISGRYGAKVHAQCEHVRPELSEWFREVKAMHTANIWTMEPVFKGREDVLERLKKAAGEGADGIWRGHVNALLFARAGEFCSSLLRPASQADARRRTRAKSAMSAAGASKSSVAWVDGLAQALGKDYFAQGDLSESSARALASVLDQHSALAWSLSEMPLFEQGAIAAQLRKEEREHGQKMYGWLESQLWVHPGERTPTLDQLLRDKAARAEFYAQQSLGGERALAPKLDLGAVSSLAVRAAKSLLKVEFEELNTQNALEEEGREMSHCVGGYASAVERGRSRIFKVEGPTKADRSTLELGRGSDGGMNVSQLRSFANKDPGVAADLASKMLARACEKSRPEQLLSVASALIDALDADAVPKAKLASAKTLMAVALREAKERDDMRSAKLAEKLAASLGKHFPETSPSPAAEPARPLAEAIIEKAKAALGRRSARG